MLRRPGLSVYLLAGICWVSTSGASAAPGAERAGDGGAEATALPGREDSLGNADIRDGGVGRGTNIAAPSPTPASDPPAPTPAPPRAASSAAGVESPIPMSHFMLEDSRVYFGKKIALTAISDATSGAPVSASVLGAIMLYPCDEHLPGCATGWAPLELTGSMRRFADGRAPEVTIPKLESLKNKPPVRPMKFGEIFRGQTAWLCLKTSPAQSEVRSADPCSTQPGYGQSEPIELELARRPVAAALSLFITLFMVFTTYLVTAGSLNRPRSRKSAVTVLPPAPPGGRPLAAPPPPPPVSRWARGWDMPMLQVAVTPSNTLSLSICQVLAWTLVVLFGQLYVWNLTDKFLTVTSDVLMLLGLGGGTALSSRVASSGRSNIPGVYLSLVQQPGRKPRLGDLVAVGGRPNIFKLQMLFFTLTSLAMVLNELIQNCSFPVLPSEYLTLMGLSSGTYVLNDWIQRSGWTELENSIRAMDAHCMERLGRLPSTVADVRSLMAVADEKVVRDYEELISRLKTYFAEDAADTTMSTQIRMNQAVASIALKNFNPGSGGTSASTGSSEGGSSPEATSTGSIPMSAGGTAPTAAAVTALVSAGVSQATQEALASGEAATPIPTQRTKSSDEGAG